MPLATKRILLMRLVSCFALVLASACATKFEFSDDFVNFRSSLDKSQALEIVNSHIVDDSTQKGVCASITYATGVPDPARLIELESSKLTFQGAKLKYEGTETTELGAYEEIRGFYSQEEAIFEMDLSQLKVIEVGVSEPPLVYSCHGFKDGFSVTIMAGDSNSLVIQVNVDREGELIAALSYLSPDAQLRSRL